jgi:hypothetical protein
MHLTKPRNISCRARSAIVWLLALGAFGVVTAAGAGPLWAGSAPAAGSADVQSEVNALRSEVEELKTELATMKKQDVVQAAPSVGQGANATPGTPKTIGEHVQALQSDLSDVKKNLADNLGVHIHGLVDGTYGYNFNEPDTTGFTKGGPNPVATGGRTNPLRVFDVNANGFSLEQFNLHIDRTVDGGVGFVTDLNFGETANILAGSTRWNNPTPGPVSSEPFDLTQAYATYTVPVGSGINLSLGKFVTLLGEEVIPTYNSLNFNESRDFIFGYAIPFTQTGLRAQYTYNDKISGTLGINNGWDDVSDNNDGQTIEAQLALTPTPSLGFTVTGNYGPEQVNHGNSKRWVIDPIATWHTPLKGLQLIGEFVHGEESNPVSTTPYVTSQGNSLNNFPAGPNGTVTITHNVQWQGAAGYIVYDWNDNIELATRGEWFEDTDGARTGLRQTLGEITETLSYKVPGVSGLLARLEYRDDMSSAKPFYTNDGFTAAGTPLHTVSGQDTLEAAAIYSY